VYAGPGVEASLPLDRERERERETVWASQAQIVDLFSLIVSSVSRHVNNIFRDSEVDRESNLKIANCFCGPTAFVLQPGRHSRSVLPRQIKPRHRFPPLGERGTHRDSLVQGVALNDRRLEQLGSIVQILSRSDNGPSRPHFMTMREFS